MFKKILVIAPHADDEVLGCGGYIWKQTSSGAVVDIAVVAAGGLHHPHLSTPATLSERQEELRKSCTILGANPLDILYPNMDMRLDTVPMVDLVAKFDAILEQGNYAFVLLPYPSYNHDHRIVFEAAWSALRPRNKNVVSAIACYEYGHVQHQAAHEFAPAGGKYYQSLSKKAFTAKIEALRCYRSQLRPNPSPANEEVVETLAKMRALECRLTGVQYAELFYLQKMIS